MPVTTHTLIEAGVPAAEMENHRIQQRQLDASRREMYSMVSEIEHYGHAFTGPQLNAMRKVMRGLRELIIALEK